MRIPISQLPHIMKCSASALVHVPEKTELSESQIEGIRAHNMFTRLINDEEIREEEKGSEIFDVVNQEYAHLKKRPIASQVATGLNVEKEIEDITLNGRLDMSYFEKDGTLVVEDFKWGYKIVEPDVNWQLLGYAICLLESIGGPETNRISLRIRQPRPYHVNGPYRSWDIDVGIIDKYLRVLGETFKSIKNNNVTYQTSENCEHCSFLNSCQAFDRAFYNSIDVAMNSPVAELSESNLHLSIKYKDVKRAFDVLEIKKSSLHKMLVERIEKGDVFQGLDLVTRNGTRKWKKEVNDDELMLMFGVDPNTKKRLSPTQYSKLVKSDELKQYIDQPIQKLLKEVDVNKIATKAFKGGN